MWHNEFRFGKSNISVERVGSVMNRETHVAKKKLDRRARILGPGQTLRFAFWGASQEVVRRVRLLTYHSNADL